MRSASRWHRGIFALITGLILTAVKVENAKAACPDPPDLSLDNSQRCSYFRLNWYGVTNATSYRVYWRNHDGANPLPPDSLWNWDGTTTGNSYDIPAAHLPWNNHTVDFRVGAVNAGDNTCQERLGNPISANSITLTDFTAYKAATPTGVYATTQNGQVTVHWDGNSANAAAKVYRDSETQPLFDNVPYTALLKTFDATCGTHNYSITGLSVTDYCESGKVASASILTSSSIPVLTSPANNGTVNTLDIPFTWTATCASGYEIEIANNSGFSPTIKDEGTSGANYTWSNATAGTYYWRVRSHNTANQQSDWSPTFSFTHPATVTVTYPNGEEQFASGDQELITWNISFAASTVDLDYTTDGGTNWTSIATGEANDGSYLWTIPSVVTVNAKVRVTVPNVSGGSDTSDNPFLIGTPAIPGFSTEWSRDWITQDAWKPAFFVEPGLTVNATFQKIVTPGSTSDLWMGFRAGCTWKFETVEATSSGDQAGWRSALTIGPSRVAGVVYLDKLTNGNYEVRYNRGTRLSSGFHTWNGGAAKGVLLATISNDTQVAVALDNNGTAHIVYGDNVGLRYVTVPSNMSPSTTTTVSTLPYAGQNGCSIAISNGSPCVAFSIDNGTPPSNHLPAMGYACLSGGSWTNQSIQTINSSYGYGVKLALNASGLPRLVCMGGPTGGLVYAKSVSGAWTFTTVTSHAIESSLALAVDASDKAHIACWMVNSQDDPTYIRERSTAPFWESSVFDTSMAAGLGSPLGIGLDNGVPIIGYAAPEGSLNSLAVAQLGPDSSPDVTAPAAVSSFTVNTGKTTAAVSWTAGDDGTTGTPVNYDFRYSTQTIGSNAAFAAATPVATSCPSGSDGCASVTGLAACTPYYFAVKVRDNAGNWSALSSVGYGVTHCSGNEVSCDVGGGDAMVRSRDDAPQSVVPATLAFAITSPNPTRGSAQFQIDVPASDADGALSVAVYDPQGRHIRTLAQETATAGRHSLAWDLKSESGAAVHHGVYFVRLQLGRTSIVRSVIVLE